MRTFRQATVSAMNALERSQSAGPPVGRAAAPGISGVACCPAAPRGPRCGPAVLARLLEPTARARLGHLDVDGGAVSKVPRADPRSGCCRRRLAAGCDRLHGQEKEEDTDEADDMYEVDFIDLANKMARQYLGRPASSAGVERLFSKAGKLYGDGKKAQD